MQIVSTTEESFNELSFNHRNPGCTADRGGRYDSTDLGSDIIRVSEGSTGDKVDQLVLKTETLRDIGFKTPRRTVLAESFFNEFFQRNGLGNNLNDVAVHPDTVKKIQHGSLSYGEFLALRKICESYGDVPLVIRSSAQGDARGTGTYYSTFSENTISAVRRAVQKVLASYFTADAEGFRRDAATGEGFGIIIEPLIGNQHEYFFAPMLSGFGYTSTSRGGAYINVVPGIGGGVQSRDGERITEEAMREHGGSIMDYVFSEQDKFLGAFDPEPLRRSALLGTDSRFGLISEGFHGDVYFAGDSYNRGHVSRTKVEYEGDFKEAYYRLNTNSFFEMINAMEKELGSPQYFEWAMTVENGEPVYWINQIAEVSKKMDLLDFTDLGQVLFCGHTVTGSGIQTCDKVAVCWNPEDVRRLHEFNRENSNYALIFSSRMTTAAMSSYSPLTYADFSNATVFLEIQDTRHTGDPLSHLGGQLDMTGKFFAVLDYSGEFHPDWKLFESREKKLPDGFKIYDGSVRVISSERQNMLVMSAVED